MKNKITTFLATFVVAMSLSAAVPLLMAQTSTTPTPSAPSVPGKKAHAGHERHPAIHEAIESLRKAKLELEHADHDFGGHRADAIKDCDKAIEQLKLALQFDKK